MKPVKKVIEGLRSAGSEPVETGSGWQSRCPCHDDQKASLTVSEAEDGKVLLHCHAGCQTDTIVAELGLSISDLFLPQSAASEPIVYRYRDKAGKVVLEKVRRERKRFLQRRPDGEGGHLYQLQKGWYRRDGNSWKLIPGATDRDSQPEDGAKWFPATPKVLYRLPEIVEAVGAGHPIFFVEGEKDAENLVKLGFEATTNPGGAGEAWRAAYGKHLRGAVVVFIPDQDEAGAELFERYALHVEKVAQELRRLDLPDGFKDISDWIEAGHTREELEALLADAPVWSPDGPPSEILDSAPETIRRPLSIIEGHAYLTTWVHVCAKGKNTLHRVVMGDDGTVFADSGVPGASPLEDLKIDVVLPHVPHLDSVLSGAGLKRYAAGERVSPAQVFEDVRTVFDHFMDFGHSLGTQADLVDLMALYVLTGYLLDAFTVIGYIWPNGDKGVGKTKLLVVTTDLAYLGVLITAGGTFASLRDLADYGATIGFDDSENIMDVRRTDPDKRTLLLAGNRRGAYVTLKEPIGDGWTTRYIHAFCPRLFSAINLPDETLASRTIVVPLVRSADASKANRDPADHELWPVPRRCLIDDLWSLGLTNLAAVQEYDRLIPDRVDLVGRLLEPWRAILAVALWLQEQHGVAGIFDRMTALAMRYQQERGDIEEASPVRVLILAVHRMLVDAESETIEFTPTELATNMNQLAVEEDIDHPGDSFTNARKVGRLLQRLRMERVQRTAGAKRWRVSRADHNALGRAYGMDEACQVAVSAVQEPSPCSAAETTATHDGIDQECRVAISAVDAVSQEASSPEQDTAPAPAAATANDLNWE